MGQNNAYWTRVSLQGRSTRRLPAAVGQTAGYEWFWLKPGVAQALLSWRPLNRCERLSKKHPPRAPAGGLWHTRSS